MIGRNAMKYIQTAFLLIICCILMTACGAQENAGENQQAKQGQAEITAQFDVTSEESQIFNVIGENITYLGMQYYGQEPVQIWAKRVYGEEEELTDIHVYWADGKSEKILQGLPAEYFDYTNAYIDNDENYYCWKHGAFVNIDESGQVLYTIDLEELELGIVDICQYTDGRIFMLVSDYTATVSPMRLAELDTVAGAIVKLDEKRIDFNVSGYIATDSSGMVFLDTEGIWTINPEDGSRNCIVSFVGTSYTMALDEVIEDFRISEDGQVEVLKTAIRSSKGVLEKLQRVEIEEKITITLRGLQFSGYLPGEWLKEQVVQFNKENDEYYVVIEECEPGNDVADFAKLTSVQISTGKGPDILCGGILTDYISGMIEKGAFVDMGAYVKKNGMKEEDYFPATFSCWREADKIYGVNAIVMLNSYQIDEAVLGNRNTPNVETLMDDLLAWQEKAVYMDGYDAGAVLRLFLEGTEDMWGMINWEKGSCDFRGDLFAKMLEVAKRYGDDERNGYPEIAEGLFFGLYNHDSVAEQIENGDVTIGVLFDDGSYAGVKTDWILAINSNSSQKDGAWEFISYLLGEEAQSTLDYRMLPVHRKVFSTLLQKELDEGVKVIENGKTIMIKGSEEDALTEAEVEEITCSVEEAKPYPIRTVPIMDIICEEAEDYFEGNKSIKEVADIIENRVKLYLEEKQ